MSVLKLTWGKIPARIGAVLIALFGFTHARAAGPAPASETLPVGRTSAGSDSSAKVAPIKEPQAEKANPKWGEAKKGEAVFKANCAMCHGDQGRGDGTLAASLPIKPRNFRDEKLHWGSTYDSVVRTISDGRSDIMPAFKETLSETEIRDVAALVWLMMPASNHETKVAPAHPGQHLISQKDKAFAPGKLVVKAGETLLFVNNDKVQHNIVSRNFSKPMIVESQKPGQWDRVQIPDKGTFEFRCLIHPNMKLTVEAK